MLQALHPLSRDTPYLFAWPLLADILPDCRAVFTDKALGPCVNSDVLPGFRQASRRVYLTATLADDGLLVIDFGADAEQVEHPIVPANADDIGDRLVLVPQQTHPAVPEDNIREIILGLAETRNVAVIVPGSVLGRRRNDGPGQGQPDHRGKGDAGGPASGLYVLVNRYDGVDLPGDACHVLVIDGPRRPWTGSSGPTQRGCRAPPCCPPGRSSGWSRAWGARRSNEDYCVAA